MNFILKKTCVLILFCLLSLGIQSQSKQVRVVQENDGWKLLVDGEPMIINGMNWDYFPIGTNYNYSLWKQPESVIRAALDLEMKLLQNMGVNTIRQYTGVPPEWISYIYKNYGIYTILNHPFGRYGLNINGTWKANTDYSDPDVERLLITEVSVMTELYKGTPGVLLVLLGNENNYGLFWQGAETEEIPIADRKSTKQAEFLYALFNKAAIKIKEIDNSRPVAMCNGDLQFMDIIARACPDVDVFGTNMYRGVSFGDAFERVKNEFGKPMMFTEFGSDAFNALEGKEDQESQAFYMTGNWKEIYANAAGMNGADNSIGGCTFQFSDGWWKYGQTKNLDVHDDNASWPNGGYTNDFKEGQNNMNEEWFGICAKGPVSERGLYELFPRAAYYALQEVHQYNPLDVGASPQSLEQHFASINLMADVLKARGDRAELMSLANNKISLSALQAKFTTFNTGGKRLSTPHTADEDDVLYPNKRGFDHMQSFFVGVKGQPTSNVSAEVKFNILGNVAQNPIDEIFYENRGRPLVVETNQGLQRVNDLERIALYSAEFSWNHQWFDLRGFYRVGHYHWGYEGDFFGLYPEAYYGPNLDTYNGQAPLGVEWDGKRALKGLKLAFGPQLWWGANSAILVKYSREFGKTTVSGIFHEDLAQPGSTVTSFVIPQPKTRRATLSLERSFGDLTLTAGGMWAGQPLVGRKFQVTETDEADAIVYQDEIKHSDNWGGKFKLAYAGGRFNFYAQTAYMGLVANGGADFTKTFTGWKLKDSGSGNQVNFLAGFTYSFGDLQIAPNFLWQRPLIGPMPFGINAPGRPRNILDDPFVVRANRETTAGEILLTYDPTPGTWMYEWDNDRAEDAKFAMNLGFVYRILPTAQDAAIGIFADGRSTFPFPSSAPAHDLWELHSRIVSKINPSFGMIANIYGGTAQANGSDARLIERFGGDLRLIYKRMKVIGAAKVNDWGPYDYHRDFNLTFPLQTSLDISTTLGKPKWYDLPSTELGIRLTWRSLDQYSNRYCPVKVYDASGQVICDQAAIGYDDGSEWEIRTYFHINIGK